MAIGTFREWLREANTLTTIYHGDNFGTAKIDPKWMLHADSNNQEGVGIYFGTLLETAEAYGKHIVKAEINHKKFIDSRANVSKLNKASVVKLLQELHNIDNEPLWYLLTDYGFEVYEPEDVQDYHLEKLYDKMKSTQIRWFQIELAQKFGTENFVKAWNKYIKIDGTFQVQDKSTNNIWYAIINTDIKLTKI